MKQTGKTAFSTVPAACYSGADYILCEQRAEALHEASKRVHRLRRAASSKAKERRQDRDALRSRDVRAMDDAALFPAMDDDGADGSRMLAAGGVL